jgi:TatD DNase family protein
MAVFYDTHAHLDYETFQQEFDSVLSRARDAGITKLIAIGTDLESSAKAVELAAENPCVYAAVGWHPCEAMAAPDDIREALRELAARPRVVAIGETGIDHYRMPSGQDGGTAEDDKRYMEKQESLFLQQLEIAREAGLNVVVHQRAAFEQTVALFKPFADDVRAVFHCFVDSPEHQKRVQELGSLVSFTGIVTFKNAESIRDTVRSTPSGHFMLETDSPYLAPVPHRGKRCEPSYVASIAETIAETRGCSLEDLSRQTCETAHAFFKGLDS